MKKLFEILKQKGAEPTSLRLITTLTIAGLLSGIIIIGIYEITLPTITKNKAEELRRAVFKVLPGISNLQKLVYDKKLRPFTGKADESFEFIYGGYDDKGKFIGYAIPSEAPGFQDIIKILYGYKPAKKVIVGMAVLQSLETPGIGDKIYKDMEFQENFLSLAVEPPIKAVKKGTKSKPNEIDAITGATISSKAITKILNLGNNTWLSRLPTVGSEESMKIVKKLEPANN
jgi:electron transport complex protein RnfG